MSHKTKQKKHYEKNIGLRLKTFFLNQCYKIVLIMEWKTIFIILICLFIGFIAGSVRERVLVSEKHSIVFAL